MFAVIGDSERWAIQKRVEVSDSSTAVSLMNIDSIEFVSCFKMRAFISGSQKGSEIDCGGVRETIA
jgi:hypothetical protein